MESEITHLTFAFISFCSCGYSPSGVYPIESLEEDVLDERYAVTYNVDFCTELDRFRFIASYNGTYIMTVNTDDVLTDLPPFKHCFPLQELI